MHDCEHLDAGSLYREHADFVRRFLMRYAIAAEDLPDLVQEVFLVAHNKGGFERRNAKPTTWLATIAHHVALRHRRTAARRHKREALDPTAIDDASAERPSPSDSVRIREQLKRVRRALKTLPGTRRAVFVMFELQGHSCVEIAEALRIPVGTVYSRLHGARSEFEQAYGSPAVALPLALSNSVSHLSLGV